MTTRILGMIGNRRTLFIVAVLGLVIALTGNPARAAEHSGTSPGAVGLQAASWLVTVPYCAVKVAYTVVGALWTSLVFTLTGGDTNAAVAVWMPAVTGDYMVRPQHLAGEKPLHFVGQSIPQD